MTRDNLREKLVMGLGLFSVGLGLWQALAPASVARVTGLGRRRKLLRFCGARELTAGAGILTRGARGPWLKSRIAGDVMNLAIIGAAFAWPRTNKTRLALTAAALTGVTGLDIYCARQFRRAAKKTRRYWI